MLRVHRKSSRPPAPGGRYAIVASLYNRRYVDGMVAAARAALGEARPEAVEVVRVPGSFEIPMAAAALARRTVERPDAILCLGVIWQGETTHAQHIGEAVTGALMTVAMETGVPVIHEVLTVSTTEQARVRCLEPKTNRGTEAAATALEMAAVLRRIRR
jgi:6,7-dimethyl-8-ribityllumazine synthase